MKYVSDIELHNIVYFRHAKFKFEKGLTFIQGRNLQRRGAQASNGSGKSLLFGVVPNMMFDAHPTITKNARSVQKELYGKGSKAVMRFTPNGKSNYTYTKTGTKVSLEKNGKDLESRIARDQLKSLFDLTEEEFFSTVYLDSRRPNMFQMGTSAERYAYITNLFRLHDMDEFRKWLNKQRSQLNGDESVLAQTKQDLEDAQARLAEIPKSVVEEAELETKRLAKATDRIQSMQSLLLQKENYDKFLEAEQKLEAVKKPKIPASELRQLLRKIERFKTATEEYERQMSERKKLRKELDELETTDKELDQMLALKGQVDGKRVDKPSKPEVSREDASRFADKDMDKLSAKRHEASAAKRAATNVLAKFDSEVGDSERCPTCHSDLSASTKKSVRQALRRDVEEAQSQLDKYDRLVKGCESYAEWMIYDKDMEKYNEFRKLEQKIEGYDFKAARRYRAIKTLLKQDAPEKPESVDQEADDVEQQLAKWERYNSLKDRVDALRCDPPEEEVDAKKIEKLQQQVRSRMDALPNLQARAGERRALVRQVTELKTRKSELETSVADLPVYKLLTDAYSTAGLKTVLVQRIARDLERNMNRQAQTIFSEDFVFAFDVADGKFNVMLTRRVEGKSLTSDIRHMSGAESRLFIFLFVLALLPLLDTRRRLNFMILDEPDANMDVETREVFRDSLLPRLAKVVPSLIVISPNSDIVPQHARVFTVVKNRGESKLIRGAYANADIDAAAVAGAKAAGHSKKSSTRSASLSGVRRGSGHARVSQAGRRRGKSHDSTSAA